MKKTQGILSVLLLVLLLLSLATAAFAEPAFFSDDSTLDGEQEATVFLAGSSPASKADVQGILFAAGNAVTGAGSAEYAFLAGNMVTLSAACERDAFAAGNVVDFTGSVGRDLLIAGRTVSLSGSVGRDLLAAGSAVSVSGSVGGNVTLRGDEILIADGAEIAGVLRYNRSAKISAPAELLARAETYEDQPAEVPAVEVKESSPLSGVKSRVFGYLGLVLLAFALLWLTPLWEKLDSVYTGAPFGRYAAAFGIGLAVLAGLPIAAILLMITGVGLRAAFVLVLLYVAAILAAPAILGFFLGALCWRGLFRQKRSYWAELPIGLLVWRLLTLIPYAKGVTALVAIPLGLGVFTLLLGKKKAAAAPELPEQTEV